MILEFLKFLLKRKKNISGDTSKVSQNESFKCEDGKSLKGMSLNFENKIFDNEIITFFCGKKLFFYYSFKLFFLFCWKRLSRNQKKKFDEVSN